MTQKTRLVIVYIAIFTTVGVYMSGSLPDRFLYYPMRFPQGEWDRLAGAHAEERTLLAGDGVHLNAWWFPDRGSGIATLFLHGNAGNVTHRVDHAEAVRAAGSGFLVVDYRGYGKSEGTPSERGLYDDAEAAYAELLRMGYAPDHIVLHGESLGTAVAAELALRRPCAGLILESPFASLSAMAGKVLPVLGPLLVHGFDTAGKISRIHVPLLVIHGDVDEIVPFSQGRTVFQKANEPKEFWAVRGGHHNDLLLSAGPEYVGRLRAFYRNLRP